MIPIPWPPYCPWAMLKRSLWTPPSSSLGPFLVLCSVLEGRALSLPVGVKQRHRWIPRLIISHDRVFPGSLPPLASPDILPACGSWIEDLMSRDHEFPKSMIVWLSIGTFLLHYERSSLPSDLSMSWGASSPALMLEIVAREDNLTRNLKCTPRLARIRNLRFHVRYLVVSRARGRLE